MTSFVSDWLAFDVAQPAKGAIPLSMRGSAQSCERLIRRHLNSR